RTGSSVSGCPYCRGLCASADNCLATGAPELAKQWHPTLNGHLTPADITMGSSSREVWWQCEAGHEWEANVCDRLKRERGCPYCSHQRVCDSNSLASCFPELVLEWHKSKNE